ncbi:hypothetical protein BDN72DRAFT_840236 [Pluteus cervinus]|uniref:Uncharacterized protein n=1 Tax=Pluteus cervinus TaxID=181527 RepID=A0ACD3AV03_9AGAR|nr:hypothetical protein BDN72DRAFT_840236 [Pluteus cervinus]
MTSLRVDHGLPSSAKIRPNPSSGVFKPRPSNDIPNKLLSPFLPSLKHSLPFGNDVRVIIRTSNDTNPSLRLKTPKRLID